ncbi:hypothetical protein GCM10027073_29250 [Streptomyces chlorus]|uniref:Uncharacterized protein n=1 Tax=Streptomyces chlorus TaxID=887452 RepID=A0ABW1E3J2_9ACTN
MGLILLRSGGVPGQNPGFSLCRIHDHGDRSTTVGEIDPFSPWTLLRGALENLATGISLLDAGCQLPV